MMSVFNFLAWMLLHISKLVKVAAASLKLQRLCLVAVSAVESGLSMFLHCAV